MVGAAGLEPATPCLEGRCSIHLSYAPEDFSSILADRLVPRDSALGLPSARPYGEDGLLPEGIAEIAEGRVRDTEVEVACPL